MSFIHNVLFSIILYIFTNYYEYFLKQSMKNNQNLFLGNTLFLEQVLIKLFFIKKKKKYKTCF